MSLTTGLAELFYLYQKQQTEDITYEAISEEEPSVKKFRSWMDDISKGLVSADKSLILVFDNMDRLPKKKVQDLWSSIHTFFAENSYPNITVLVPFDRAHVEIAFTESQNAPNYGGDFINKTFNVVYRVSPPVLSDWKSFFSINWQKAFRNNYDKERYDRVTQVYDILAEDITPRRIIAFINEFVSIKHIQPNIPEQYVALFILKKSEILKKPFSEIIDPTYLAGSDFIYDDRDELAKNIGALVYQIDAEKAIQVIYTSRLTKSLNNNNISDAQLISKSNEFFDILQSAMLTVSNYDNTIICLNQIEAQVKNQIWEDIYVRVIKQNIEGQVLQEFQKVLFVKTTQKENYLIKVLSDFKKSGNFNALNCYNSINELEKYNTDKKLGLFVFQNLPDFKTSPIDFIAFVKVAKDEYSKYKIDCDPQELDSHLESLAFNVENLSSIEYLPFIKEAYHLPRFISKLEQTIEASKGNSAFKPLMELLYERYKDASTEKPVEKVLEESAIDILLTLSDSNENFFYDLAAMAFTKLPSYIASYPNTLSVLLASATDEQIEKIASRIEYYLTYGDLLLQLIGLGNFPTYVKVVEKLTVSRYGSSKMAISFILQNFSEITAPGKINPENLILRLDGWSKEFEKINFQSIKKTIPETLFFEQAINTANDFTSSAVKKLIQYLNSVKLDDWKTYLLQPNSYEYKALLLLQQYSFNIDGIDAVKYTLNKITQGEVAVPDKTNWEVIISKMPQIAKIATFKDIRDRFCEHDIISVSMFKFFAKGLFNWGQIEKRETAIRKIFTSDILRDSECREIIEKYKQDLNFILAGSDQDDAIDFRNRIQELMESVGENDPIFSIAQELQIERRQPDKLIE